MKWRTSVGLLLCLCLLLFAVPSSFADESPPDTEETSEVSTAAGTGDVMAVVQSGTVGANTFDVLRVLCPPGMVAVGGGIDPFNVFLMEVTASGPVFPENNQRLIFQPDGDNPAPVGWQAAIRNNQASSQSYKVAAICVRDATVSTVVGSVNVAGNNFNGLSIACPFGKVAVGGGVDLANVLTMTVTSSGPTFGDTRLLFQPDGEHPAPNGWRAFARTESATAGSLKMAVICSSATTIRSVVASATVGANTFGVTEADCPEGTVALNGGIDPFNVLLMRVTTSAPFFPSGTGTRLLFQPDGENIAPTTWWAGVRNYQAMSQTYKVAVICKPPVYIINLPLITR